MYNLIIYFNYYIAITFYTDFTVLISYFIFYCLNKFFLKKF